MGVRHDATAARFPAEAQADMKHHVPTLLECGYSQNRTSVLIRVDMIHHNVPTLAEG
ncbi:MAG: hypothetical protein K2H84_01040 [Paramuribaculum sp.]|nr:hypothetical protein [Paramuribaculum sp.]